MPSEISVYLKGMFLLWGWGWENNEEIPLQNVNIILFRKGMLHGSHISNLLFSFFASFRIAGFGGFFKNSIPT